MTLEQMREEKRLRDLVRESSRLNANWWTKKANRQRGKKHGLRRFEAMEAYVGSHSFMNYMFTRYSHQEIICLLCECRLMGGKVNE